MLILFVSSRDRTHAITESRRVQFLIEPDELVGDPYHDVESSGI